MSEEREHIWTDGLFYNMPHEKAPDFVLGSLSIEPKAFTEWMRQHYDKNEKYIKIDIKMGKTGKPYTELNTYKPNQTQGQGGGGSHRPPQKSQGSFNANQGSSKDFEDDIPF